MYCIIFHFILELVRNSLDVFMAKSVETRKYHPNGGVERVFSWRRKSG